MLSPCEESSSDTCCPLESQPSESLLTIQSEGSIFCDKNLMDEVHSVVSYSSFLRARGV